MGRIHIADELKTVAGIEKKVVFVGTLDHIEVWDQEKYHEYIEKIGATIEEKIEVIDGI